MNPLAVNLTRTYVPVLVGAIASWGAARGIHVQPQETSWAVAAMTAVFTAAYYTIVRVLEERFPAVGPLLLLSRPATSLHVVSDCPADAQAEDYGENWPPRADDYDRPGYEPPRDDYTTLHPAQPLTAVPQPPAPTGPNPVPPAPTRPEPLRVRKADTGAIPAYRRPPGR